MIKYYVGIDPGKTGGIVFLPEKLINEDADPKDLLARTNSTYTYIPRKDENDNIDIVHLSEYLKTWHKDHDLYPLIEHVWAMPKQGVSSMFSFGYVTGQVEACFETITGRKCKRVAPQTWQRYILGINDNQKEAAVEHIKELFPHTHDEFKTITKTGKTSKNYNQGLVDAYCIAEYALKKYKEI